MHSLDIRKKLLPFHANFGEFVKMIGKLSFSVHLVCLIGKVVIDIRCATR